MHRQLLVAGATAFAFTPTNASSAERPPGTMRSETRHCITELLPAEAIAAGKTNDITCASTPQEAFDSWAQRSGKSAQFASTTLAVHYDNNPANGANSLTITGTACDGGGISLSAGDWWNDKIRYTRHMACSDIKHWVHANYTGDAQITQGSWNSLVGLNGTLAGQVSSIGYYGD